MHQYHDRASHLARLKNWARRLKSDIVALWLAARDPRTPLLPKMIAAVVAAYALSPIDLIPDFIPVLGYVDDVLLLPLGIALAIRLIPPGLMEEFRTAALLRTSRPRSAAAAVFILLVWIASLAAVWLYWA